MHRELSGMCETSTGNDNLSYTNCESLLHVYIRQAKDDVEDASDTQCQNVIY